VQHDGTGERPRVSVFRSNRGVFVQLIVDDAGRCVGIVSRTDLLESTDAQDAPVSDVASTDLVTVGRDESLLAAMQLILDEHVDHKTVLQEDLARRGGSVTYSLIETSGPDHDRRFTTAALVDGAELGRGSGVSKKASEQEAAREALRRLSGTGN